MNKLFCFTLIVIIASSCINSGNRRETPTTPSATQTFNAPETPPGVTKDSDKSSPAGGNNIQPTAPATQTKNTTTANTGVNPAHGQPGHRCDIPEGAPLNSPAISTTIPGTNSNVTTKPVVNQPQPAKSKVRLNPAHGLPGHDCSIAVGQPLKN